MSARGGFTICARNLIAVCACGCKACADIRAGRRAREWESAGICGACLDGWRPCSACGFTELGGTLLFSMGLNPARALTVAVEARKYSVGLYRMRAELERLADIGLAYMVGDGAAGLGVYMLTERGSARLKGAH